MSVYSLDVLGCVLGCLGQYVCWVCAASASWGYALRCERGTGLCRCTPSMCWDVCWDVCCLRALGYVLGYVLGCGLGVLGCLGQDVCRDACCPRVLGFVLGCVPGVLRCLGQYVCWVCDASVCWDTCWAMRCAASVCWGTC